MDKPMPELEVGDKVTRFYWGGFGPGRYETTTIINVTKTRYTTANGTQWDRKTGRVYGDKWSATAIVKVGTPEDIERRASVDKDIRDYKIMRLRTVLEAYPEQWRKNLNDETARQIYEILNKVPEVEVKNPE